MLSYLQAASERRRRDVSGFVLRGFQVLVNGMLRGFNVLIDEV